MAIIVRAQCSESREYGNESHERIRVEIRFLFMDKSWMGVRSKWNVLVLDESCECMSQKMMSQSVTMTQDKCTGIESWEHIGEGDLELTIDRS